MMAVRFFGYTCLAIISGAILQTRIWSRLLGTRSGVPARIAPPGYEELAVVPAARDVPYSSRISWLRSA